MKPFRHAPPPTSPSTFYPSLFLPLYDNISVFTDSSFCPRSWKGTKTHSLWLITEPSVHIKHCAHMFTKENNPPHTHTHPLPTTTICLEHLPCTADAHLGVLGRCSHRGLVWPELGLARSPFSFSKWLCSIYPSSALVLPSLLPFPHLCFSSICSAGTRSARSCQPGICQR